jgi:3-hydroxyisobutyrate dehydrogenase-like beta-hydroxyacid dehydrogenase
MLLDDQAYEEVFFGVHRLIDALSPGTLHLLCGSISVGLGERFVVEHARRDIDLVMATLAGTSDDARQGCLRVAVRGSETAVDRARPLLEAFSRFS